MKNLFIFAIIVGFIAFCGIVNVPCFADDSNSGVTVPTTITVTGNSGSSGGGYYGGGYRYIEPDYSTTTTPIVPTDTVPPVIPAPPAYVPPPNEPLPQVTPAVGEPMPAEQSTIHIGWFLVGGGILVIGLMVWYLWNKKRKPKKLEMEQPR